MPWVAMLPVSFLGILGAGDGTMLYGYKEGFEIVYDIKGNLRVDDDEVILSFQGNIFPRIYKNWEHYGVTKVFEPLMLGRVYITSKRIAFISDADEKIPSEYRDFFSIPLDEIYGCETKKKTSVSGHDVNIYIQTLEGEKLMLSMVIPDMGEEGIYRLLKDLEIDGLEKLKRNPKFYHSKVGYVRRNIWATYMSAIENGKLISDSEGLETCIIEDIFAISKNGLLIWHETWKSEKDMDDDIFSGMVYTLQNFIRDSFEKDTNVDLREVDLGNFKIYIDKGDFIYLIVVYTGTLNEKVKDKIKDAIVEIETINRPVLEHWDGDTSRIENIKDVLAKLF